MRFCVVVYEMVSLLVSLDVVAPIEKSVLDVVTSIRGVLDVVTSIGRSVLDVVTSIRGVLDKKLIGDNKLGVMSTTTEFVVKPGKLFGFGQRLLSILFNIKRVFLQMIAKSFSLGSPEILGVLAKGWGILYYFAVFNY